MMSLVKKLALPFYSFVFPTGLKRRAELKYWRGKYVEQEGNLSNSHYQPLYTEVYGLTTADYSGKRVLDIGCGPRGSLEWADMTAQRVGLDPLALDYRNLGTERHKMEYAASGSEHIPFLDEYFDIVTCLNALDHVDDIDATIGEIKRVVRHGGTFLLSVETDHEPTAAEPVTVDDAKLASFAPEFAVVTEFRVGTPADHDLHRAVRTREPAYVAGEPGIYVARFLRK